METAEGMEIKVTARDIQPVVRHDHDVPEQDVTMMAKVRNCLHMKDMYHVSDECWHELVQIKGTNLPPLSQIKKSREQQNQLLDITALPQVLYCFVYQPSNCIHILNGVQE